MDTYPTLYKLENFLSKKQFFMVNKTIINFVSLGLYQDLKIALNINSFCLKKISVDLIGICIQFLHTNITENYLQCICLLLKYNYPPIFQNHENKNILHFIFSISHPTTEESELNNLVKRIIFYCTRHSKHLFYQKDIYQRYPIEYGVEWVDSEIWNYVSKLDYFKLPLLNHFNNGQKIYDMIENNDNNDNEENLLNEIKKMDNILIGNEKLNLLTICHSRSHFFLFDYLIPKENAQNVIPYLSYLISENKLSLLPLHDELFMTSFINVYLSSIDIHGDINNTLCFYIMGKLLSNMVSKSLINLVYKLCSSFYHEIGDFIELEVALENDWSFVVLQQCRYHSDIFWHPLTSHSYILHEVIDYMTPKEIISFISVYTLFLDEIISSLSKKKINEILQSFFNRSFPHFEEYLYRIFEKIYFYHQSEEIILKLIECRIGHSFIRRYIEDGNYHILPNIKNVPEFISIYSYFYPNFKKIACPLCRKINYVNLDFPRIKGVNGTCCVCMERSPEIVFPNCCHLNTCFLCVQSIIS